MKLTTEDVLKIALSTLRGAGLATYAESMGTRLTTALHAAERLCDALETSNATTEEEARDAADQYASETADDYLQAEADFLAAILDYVEYQHSAAPTASSVSKLLPW